MIIIAPIDNDYNNGFTVQGHAGFAPHGFDIVCAGISTLVRIVYNTLSYTNDLTVRFADGDALIQLHDVSEVSKRIIQGFLETVEEIQNLHPEHIKIEEDTYNVKN